MKSFFLYSLREFLIYIGTLAIVITLLFACAGCALQNGNGLIPATQGKARGEITIYAPGKPGVIIKE